MPFILFFLLVLLPIIEIALIIKLGYAIGFWPTLGIIIVTAIAGTYLLRQQGLSVMNNAQNKMNKGGLPMQEAFDGVALLLAGAFLLTPGIVTDSFGFLLLIPAFRRWAGKAILNQIKKSGKFSFSQFEMNDQGETNTYHYETSDPFQPSQQTGKKPEKFDRDAQNAEIIEVIPPDEEGKPNQDSPWHKK